MKTFFEWLKFRHGELVIVSTLLQAGVYYAIYNYLPELYTVVSWFQSSFFYWWIFPPDEPDGPFDYKLKPKKSKKKVIIL